ncbi:MULTISPECIES: replication initiator [Streptomyces]|uniref:Plasmid replication initiator protein n=1 Tax=Streptomyces coelicolor (strain ATCC BAA-471 / A3(2) / M145) TaxID=100226 RepID=Q9ZBZ4_STRCO|nr:MULTISPECIES: replication initiator [Streptomyces]MYU43460.1 plasmid replication initiator protein [Streptomyces sp. SID7813]QFI43934.1 plasmid replication initiator protein [Streptomyces coelicolor A3(2)]THA94658.1 plasmid replication initiator protein [Streptomyces sp. LRa12]CAA22208.1 putative plasmid replication initiator protein [Streptomyces coelicolor A3(2)]
MRHLPEADRDALRIAQDPDFPRWLQQITATGGCAHPVHLSGHTTTLDNATGEILRHYDTRNEPGERLLVRCRNRRSTVCGPCSRLHAGDTFHLVRAGLLGGKNVPASVRTRPRLFVTLTAPSFGAVHRAGQTCRPRRDGGACEHGRPLGCGTVHAPDAPAVGQPLCPDCYDYTAHVLWHAHASKLWDRFVIDVRRRLASSAGIVQSRFAHHARLSFARIAEYQKRAAVHVHTVVRLDGPDGPTDEPPAWGTTDRLTRAVHASAQRVTVRTPYSLATGELELSWGTQTDVCVLHAKGDGPDDDAVAAYVAKYVSKGTDETGAGTDHKVTTCDDIDSARVSRHVRTLMHTCWRLGGLPEYAPLRLRTWTHTLGYRGHILTKSRAYSTTYAALRAQRAHHHGHTDTPDAITDAHWRYVGSGHTPGAALIAAGVAEDIAQNRAAVRDALSAGGGAT